MTAARALRVVASLIALTAFIDPAFTRDLVRPRPLTLAVLSADGLDHAERLRRHLAADYDVRLRVFEPGSPAAACPATGACVLVARDTVPERVTAGALIVGGVRVPERASDVIRTAGAPRRTHRDAAALVHVSLARRVPRVEIFDGDVLVGAVDPGDALAVAVPWVPLADGARLLRVMADGDVVHVGVSVDAAPADVLVYEPEPTWIGTFVRRALQDDVRFRVRGRTRVAPPVVVSHGTAGALNAATLAPAGAVVVTAPHALSREEIDLLERFVTRRGGTVIVLPDRRPTGAALRLLPPIAGDQRSAEPRAAGLLRVREWLTFDPASGATPLALIGDQPVVVSQPLGRGRIVVSGALDAWRFRDETSNFATFWTGLVWEGVAAAGEPLNLSVDRIAAAPGHLVRVQAELQTLDAPPADLQAHGRVRCDEQDEPLRLWPGARPGTFDGEWRPTAHGTCELEVAVNGIAARHPIIVSDDVQGSAAAKSLDAVLRAHGAQVVNAGDEDALLGHLQRTLPAAREPVESRPMRSWYWLVLFTACLCGEWWLRRRAGLR